MREKPENVSDFHPDKLLEFARIRTGLSDFGEGYFLEPLSVLTTAISNQAEINDAGIAAMGERLVNALANRLRRIALFQEHPEIDEEQVDVAALIVGLPRTGSTMLHRLLCASHQATGVLWWESVFPVPRVQAEDRDIPARKAEAEKLVSDIMSAADGFDAIHPLDAHAYDEELPLIEQSFMSNMPESMMYVPDYGNWLLAADQGKAYDELIDFMKIFQWHDASRSGQKWILKCPHHLTAVNTVLDAFPEAAIVMTHRPINQLMPSWYSMVASLTGAYSDTDHAAAQADHWTERLRRNLVDMVEARKRVPERFVDVGYKDLLKQPLEQAAHVFNAAGIAVAEEDKNEWQGWLDGNKRGNRPKHVYSLDEFGISEGRLAKDFAFYTDEYPAAGG